MPRKIQTTYTQHRDKFVACIGDSLTMNTSYPVTINLYYPERLAVGLRALGVAARSVNAGISGQTSTQILARVGALYNGFIPSLVVIWAGHNDDSNGIEDATTQSNLEAIVDAVIAAGGQRVVICSTHLRNYASGGNIIGGVPQETPPIGAQLDLWNAQHGAYLSRVSTHPGKVAWCDIWDKFYTVLQANPSQIGVDTFYHTAAGDVHLNAVGEQYVADAILAAVQAQNGWMAALT